jgi:hypothetical protein
MRFDPFVLPFTIGLIALLCTLTWKFASWIMQLTSDQREAVRKNIVSIRTLKGVREIYWNRCCTTAFSVKIAYWAICT